MAKSIIDRIIYKITQKPPHYKEVKNPPRTAIEKLLRPQAARQVLYNKWSIAHQIYSGSYLPYSQKELLKQGWVILPTKDNKTPYNKRLIKKRTGQNILRHETHTKQNGTIERTHYHWLNPDTDGLSKKKRNDVYYIDKYGEICARGSFESHIKPRKTRRKRKCN